MNIPSRPLEIDRSLLDRFDPITLERMDAIRLMNRIDTKYVTDILRLREILEDAQRQGHLVFESDGERIQAYDSIYFDTSDLRMFREHRRGKLVRQKIRTRVYLGSGLCFLEVKKKNNHSRTRKKRVGVPPDDFQDFREDPEACLWLASHSCYQSGEIFPSVETMFNRITLVNNNLTERLTIDISVTFKNLRTSSEASLGTAAIIEIKQDGRLGSKMKDILLKHRVKPMRVSKYCLGVALTDPKVLPGRFKSKIRFIDKLNKNRYTTCYNPVLHRPL